MTNLLLGWATPTGNPEGFFVLTPESPGCRALQTRVFETSDERALLSASAAVLQDMGCQVEESEVEMGILRAAKGRSAREFWQEFTQGMVLLLSATAPECAAPTRSAEPAPASRQDEVAPEGSRL